MGEVVNLRLQRKRAVKRAADAGAAENRLVHGLSKSTRKIAERREAIEAARLDGHRLSAATTSASGEALAPAAEPGRTL